MNAVPLPRCNGSVRISDISAGFDFNKGDNSAAPGNKVNFPATLLVAAGKNPPACAGKAKHAEPFGEQANLMRAANHLTGYPSRQEHVGKSHAWDDQ